MSKRYDGVSKGQLLFDCPCCLMPDIEIQRSQSKGMLAKIVKVRAFIYSKDTRAVQARNLIRSLLKDRKAEVPA